MLHTVRMPWAWPRSVKATVMALLTIVVVLSYTALCSSAFTLIGLIIRGLSFLHPCTWYTKSVLSPGKNYPTLLKD